MKMTPARTFPVPTSPEDRGEPATLSRSDLAIPQPEPAPQLSAPEEKQLCYIKMCEAMDNLPMYADALKPGIVGALTTLGNTGPSLPPEEAVSSEPQAIEHSLQDRADDRDVRPQDAPTQPEPPAQPPQSSPSPVPSNGAVSLFPKIKRHKGQRVQTFKAIYTITPIQYRRAFDMLKTHTRRSGKEVMCEAIGDMAVKCGLVRNASDIRNWPDWD